MQRLTALLIVGSIAAAPAIAQTDPLGQARSADHSGVVIRDNRIASLGNTVIYDTTHASLQGAEIAAAANGLATRMADKIVLAGTDRFVCEVQVELFTLTAATPFDLTLTMWTDCTSSGAAGSACGTGPGALIPNSTLTMTNVTPPGTLGTIFTVTFTYAVPVDLTTEADNTISVALQSSRSDVFWRIGETPAVGSIPAGEPATSFVERCGSTGANNGCSRNFGLNNNFALMIKASTTPVELESYSID